ncbi:glycosyltransferase [Lutibacter sp.]|uniref:glycosyltransferase family 2 protein n=1 Tax=Lutibacter sp. TaxID=1925666 RepID=UPI001A2937E6|nr:glycosyltransferase [Lutibacter sp.]MBI9040576.1 glycosyltransferase [Lutibacter sp.]
MISILIPVYNYNIENLITKLNFQLSKANIEYEIICIDDASEKYLNEINFIIPNFRLIELKTNVGRSKIRNILVKESKFEWLLFLDTDVLPENKNFIINYIDFIKKNSNRVCCGGIVYQRNKPESSKLLRWVYGKKREEIQVSKRTLNPYEKFSGANILINKSIFENCSFNENISKYGYEDLLFAEDLKKNKISISHIYNPVCHFGLDNNLIFLEKTKQALENLNFLRNNDLLTGKSIKILKIFNIIKAIKLNRLLVRIFINFHKSFEYNLKSNKPNLIVFDTYKLLYFCYLNK